MEHRFLNLEKKLCRELEVLEEKYRSGAEMSEGDLRKIDLLSHSLKSLTAFVEKKQIEDMNYSSRGSYSMGNTPYMNSYNSMYGNNSYNNNSYGMQGNSMYSNDHMPYPQERRW